MNDLWLEIIKQVPAMGVLAAVGFFTIKLFLKHLENKDTLTSATFERIAKNSDAALKDSTEALKANTQMFGRVNQVLDHVQRVK